MLNCTANTAETRIDAVVSTEHHLRRHGKSLFNLLDAIDDPVGFEAFCDLHGAFGETMPDPDVIEAALREIRRVLEDQRPSALDRIEQDRRLPVPEMTRWHGARLTDLLSMFHYVD
ncbi:hypothetical protein [Pseudooceanicola sp. LIPI14-2-Ac024]|uniref:hypothetical protein n=1 Tax=Pseudooceanicola sp. LIPI14-2-Ac024 TaxID=3344875 RepID=UPI0035D0DEFD